MHPFSRLTTVVLALMALLAAAPDASGQLFQADWAGAGPGYWDDPAMWNWPGGGAPPEGYPHDTWADMYDCRLLAGGDMAVLRDDAGVFDVMLAQELKLVDDATLTLTAHVDDGFLPGAAWHTMWPHRYPLAISQNGLLHGTGEVRALGAGIIGTVKAIGVGEDLTFAVDDIFLDGAGGARLEARDYGSLTVQCNDLEIVSGGQQGTIRAVDNARLRLSGHIHGTGDPILADTGSTLELDGAKVEYGNALRVQNGSHADIRDSSVLTTDVSVDHGSTMHVYNSTFYDALLPGGPDVTVMNSGGGFSHLAVKQGYSHIGNLNVQEGSTLTVEAAGHLEVDHMDLGPSAVCTVSGVIETLSPTSWSGSSGNVVLAGGEIRGGFQSDVPLSGYGTIATSEPGPTYPGLQLQADLAVENGVLELAPGAFLAHESPVTHSVKVFDGAEFFINDAMYLNEHGQVGVKHGGTLRLYEATLDGGDGEVRLGIPGGSSIWDASLVATGENESEYDLVLLDGGSVASIQWGETEFGGLANAGEISILPGASLLIDVEDAPGADRFENTNEIVVGGRLEVRLNNETTGTNEGLIELYDDGVFHLWGNLEGEGDILVADDGTFHPHDCEYVGGGQSIRLEGGTLRGAMYTDHAVGGYGTVTGAFLVETGGITADTFGETLLITNAQVQLIGDEQDGGLTAAEGAILKIEDAGVMSPDDDDPGNMPRFRVRGPAGAAPPSDPSPMTIMFLRDASVRLPGHVGAGGILVADGDTELLGVEVHNRGQMVVWDETAMVRLDVGTMDPFTEAEGGGEALITPGATLSVQSVGVFDGTQGGQGLLRVEGDLHFRNWESEMGYDCTLEGNGIVELAGGVISGEATVLHNMPQSIHGHGRISAALVNSGTVSADTPGAWLRLDTNDKVSDGLIEATEDSLLALDEIRLDNYGTIDIHTDARLLVDASILDCHDTGTLNVDGGASLELRRGGAIVNCPAMATGLGSTMLVGGVGQTTAPDPDVAYNEFALPAMDHAGTLTVYDPVTTGQAAPDTGHTVLTVGGDFDTSGQVTVDAGSTMLVQGPYTQSDGTTTVDGLMVALGGPVVIDGGTMDVSAADTGTLDLTENNLVVDYERGASPFDQVEAWVVSGYGGGTWDGTGIASSTAAGDGMPTAVGVGDNVDPLLGLEDLEGEPLDADGTDVLVKFTWYGDVNLDGVVDAADYAVMDQSWNGGSQSPAGGGDWRWACGDVNYDGTVDAADYALIDQVWNNYGGQTLDAGAPAPLGGAAVPEPATLALVVLGAGAMLARRRS